MIIKIGNKFNHMKYNLCDIFDCQNETHIYFHKEKCNGNVVKTN